MSHARVNEFTIGLFDSGVGGLSVLRQLEKIAARATAAWAYRFVYLGDTARCPYGDREPQEIVRFVHEIGDWLLAQGAQALVMACNTSAACAVAEARARFPVEVHDLITPTAEHVASLGVKTAVLATASTVRRKAFSQAIAACNPNVEVVEVACPELVPIIEKGLIEEPQTRDTLWSYIRDLQKQNVKALIFGCTHYPFLSDVLAELLPDMLLIDPAEQLARSLICSSGKIFGAVESESENRITRDIYVTGSPETFAATAQVCLRSSLGTVCGVSVDDLCAVPSVTVSPVIPNSSVDSLAGTRAVP